MNDSGVTASEHGSSPALRALVEDMLKWHENAVKSCLNAAENAEAIGQEHLARHQYAACGVHEMSAAWIRKRILPAAAAEGASSEGVNP